ncbi:MAG: RrF2 family transcriptional regulator [Clostridia bacterium]|jgi:Rrf2 family cysteine metabolism transcriptional repressor|nr:Rrf2 family transcriptional regulator [Clostridiaceae bacterium]
MRLSRKSEYALLALVEMAKLDEQDTIRIVDICERCSIPKKYLEQILLQLKGTGYVKSVRGSQGGYRLAKNPEDITVAEIIRLIDGPLAPVGSASIYFYEKTPIEQNEKLLEIMKDIRSYAARRLENTTLKDLV